LISAKYKGEKSLISVKYKGKMAILMKSTIGYSNIATFAFNKALALKK